MSGVTPVYSCGPITYEVNVAVTGGQLVEPDSTTGKIKPAVAGTALCLGVATTDAIPTSTNQNPTGSILVSPIAPHVAVAYEGVWRLTATGAIGFGVLVKTAANGTVAPWVSGTDAAGLIVGRCIETAGIANGAKGQIRLGRIG
jgi:hypothetical protein